MFSQRNDPYCDLLHFNFIKLVKNEDKAKKNKKIAIFEHGSFIRKFY